MQALSAQEIFVDAICQLLVEKPISEVRVREICDIAQLSTRSFYNYYQDKYELASDALLEALRKALSPFIDEDHLKSLDSIEIWAYAAQGTEESHRFNKALVDFFIQNPHFFDHLLQDTSQNSPYYEWKKGITHSLYVANERFGNPKCCPESLAFAAEQIYNGITFTHKTWIKKYRYAKQVPFVEVVHSDKRILGMALVLLEKYGTLAPFVNLHENQQT